MNTPQESIDKLKIIIARDAKRGLPESPTLVKILALAEEGKIEEAGLLAANNCLAGIAQGFLGKEALEAWQQSVIDARKAKYKK